jgi:hypothetical protein
VAAIDTEQCHPERPGLVTAEAVLANAGFELASEALHLGKKLVLRPIHGQMEQEANALACEQLGLGAVLRALEPDAVRRGLEGPAATPRPVPDWVGGFVGWISRGVWRDVDGLVEASWRQAPRVPQPVS